MGARISRVHGENGANEINKSQREKEAKGSGKREKEREHEKEDKERGRNVGIREARGKRETQDEMEFLSVGLDKQPQFRSRDRNQPKRRRRDARFYPISLCPLPPIPPTARIFLSSSWGSYFRGSPFLVPLRVQLLVQSSVLYLPWYRRFYCDRLDQSSLFSSLFPFFLHPCIVAWSCRDVEK